MYLVFTQFWTTFDLIFESNTLKLLILQEKASSKENCAEFDASWVGIAINITFQICIKDIYLRLHWCLMDTNIHGCLIDSTQRSQRHLYAL